VVCGAQVIATDVAVRASEKGYINKDLFAEFGESSIRYLRTNSLVDGRPHMLVMDSHYNLICII